MTHPTESQKASCTPLSVLFEVKNKPKRTVKCVLLSKDLAHPDRWVSPGYISLEAFKINEDAELLFRYPRYAAPEAVQWWTGYDNMEGGIQSYQAPQPTPF